MKKIILPAILIASVMIPAVCYGQTIQTGNASAKSTVETNIGGSGAVYTKQEVEVNGQTKTLETTGSGTHTLEINSNENQANGKVQNGEIKATPSAAVTPKMKNKINNKIQRLNSGSWLTDFKNLINNFLKNMGLNRG